MQGRHWRRSLWRGVEFIQIITGDCRTILKTLPDQSIQCCVTSPPYWGLRDYGHADQIGLEDTPQAYVETMRQVFAEVWRVLRDDGTLWLNLGDCYAAHPGQRKPTDAAGSPKQLSNGGSIRSGSRSAAGLKPKDLIGIPWRVALALQSDGWYLRSDIIWHKPNPMPESVTDRCTKSHEYIFMLTKSEKYFYDADAIREAPVELDWESRLERNSEKSFPTKERNGIRVRRSDKMVNYGMGVKGSEGLYGPRTTHAGGRNKRSVWTVPTSPYTDAHFATFPPDLIKPCILAGTKPGDVVLDPFFGSGTTGMVSLELGRKCIGIELNGDYRKLSDKRCDVTRGLPL